MSVQEQQALLSRNLICKQKGNLPNPSPIKRQFVVKTKLISEPTGPRKLFQAYFTEY